MVHWVLAKVEKDQVWIYPLNPSQPPIGFWKSPESHYSHQFLIGMGCIVPDFGWAIHLAKRRGLDLIHVKHLPFLVPTDIEYMGVVDFDYLIEATPGMQLDKLPTQFYYPSIQAVKFPLNNLAIGHQRWKLERSNGIPVFAKYLGACLDSAD